MENSNEKPLGASQLKSYYDIPLDMIRVEDQIRSGIDMENDAFLALKESIREKGVLEPVIVTPSGDMYLLISGERRFLVCQQLGLPAIPARVLDAVTAKEEIIALQLTENLHRENLDPIDEANALFAYIKSRHPSMDLDAVINGLILYKRDQSRTENEFVPTVGTTSQLSGKSITSLLRSFSLLKLPGEIQAAVKEGLITVSQGYIFAANLDNPGLMETFNAALATSLTNAALESKLAAFTKVTRSLSGMRPKPFAKFYLSLRSVKTSITKSAGKYKKSDLEKLLSDLKAVTTLLEEKLQAPGTGESAATGDSTTNTESTATDQGSGQAPKELL
jgi:ParB-like chromosome segregation protein Spo0J